MVYAQCILDCARFKDLRITYVSHGDICAVQRTASLLAADLFITHTAFKIQTTLNVGSSDLCTLGHVGELTHSSPVEAGSFGTRVFFFFLPAVDRGLHGNASRCSSSSNTDAMHHT